MTPADPFLLSVSSFADKLLSEGIAIDRRSLRPTIRRLFGIDIPFDIPPDVSASGSAPNADIASRYERSLDRVQRKRQGSFYTPADIVSFMIDRAFAYGGSAAQRMFDPAFGCGGFILEYLSRRIASYTIPAMSDDALAAEYRALIDACVGYETDSGAYRIAAMNMLSLLVPFAKEFDRRGIAAPHVMMRITLADALSADASFRTDMTVFNPPYFGEKGNKQVFDNVLLRYPRWKDHYRARMDYLYWFLVLGIESLADGGVMTAVTSTYWFTAASADRIRELVRTRTMIREIILFDGDAGIFPQANVHAAIFTLTRSMDERACAKNRPRIVSLSAGNREGMLAAFRAMGDGSSDAARSFSASQQQDMTGAWVFSPKRARAHRGQVLGDICEIRQGVVPNPQRITARMASPSYHHGEPIFVFDRAQYDAFAASLSDDERVLVVPFHKNSDIRPGGIAEHRYYLLYVDGDTDISRYPSIEKHLLRFKDILSARRECRAGKIPWYSLHWPRMRSMFTSPAVVCPYLCRSPIFVHTAGIFAASDVYFITAREGAAVDLPALAGHLNSRTISDWMHANGPKKGGMFMCTSDTLHDLPVPNAVSC